jgi:hypothetical protein
MPSKEQFTMRRYSGQYSVGVSLLGVLAVGAAGCGPLRTRSVTPPALDAAAVTAAVMAQADTDGDGQLTKQELERVPALAASLAALDTNADGRLAAAELRAWLDAVRGAGVAFTPLTVSVTHNGKPLEAAEVRLVPESFMGAQVAAATGQTDSFGNAVLNIPESGYPGVHCGLYRIEITGTGNDGKPLPPRFNAESTLGAAVGANVPEYYTASVTLD